MLGGGSLWPLQEGGRDFAEEAIQLQDCGLTDCVLGATWPAEVVLLLRALKKLQCLLGCTELAGLMSLPKGLSWGEANLYSRQDSPCMTCAGANA